jgi:hypothetical protein
VLALRFQDIWICLGISQQYSSLIGPKCYVRTRYVSCSSGLRSRFTNSSANSSLHDHPDESIRGCSIPSELQSNIIVLQASRHCCNVPRCAPSFQRHLGVRTLSWKQLAEFRSASGVGYGDARRMLGQRSAYGTPRLERIHLRNLHIRRGRC